MQRQEKDCTRTLVLHAPHINSMGADEVLQWRDNDETRVTLLPLARRHHNDSGELFAWD